MILSFLFATLPHPAGAQEKALVSEPEEERMVQNESSASAEATQSEALQHGHRGLQLFSGAQWEQAYAQFFHAEELAHSPVFVFYMAQSKHRQGKFYEALQLYRRCAGEKVSSSTPGPWMGAIEKAKAQLSLIEPLVPRVRLSMSGKFVRPFIVRSDGRIQPVSGDSVWWEAPVGDHRFVVEDANGRTVERLWTAKASPREVTIVFHFSEQHDELKVRRHAKSMATEPQHVDETQAPWSGYRRAAISAFSVSGAGVIFGVITGGIAISQTNSIKSRCQGNKCEQADEALFYKAQTNANLATAGFVVGAVGAVTGVTLWMLPGPHSEQVQLQARGSSLYLSGSF